MRDRRFVAVHRGGPLDKESHVWLARWAADCAESVLPYFVRSQPLDDRPAQALAVARAWANGEVKTGAAMRASLAAHAAARDATDKAAIAAARAAGHAVATAHMADHSMGALIYAVKTLEAAGLESEEMLRSRFDVLPDRLRDQVESGVRTRLAKLGNHGSRTR